MKSMIWVEASMSPLPNSEASGNGFIEEDAPLNVKDGVIVIIAASVGITELSADASGSILELMKELWTGVETTSGSILELVRGF